MTAPAPPRVSIVLPFRDETRFLSGAIETVQRQTFDGWELLLVDDGSTDGSGEVADRAAAAEPGRVRVVRHPGRANRGLPASRNAGLAAAAAPLIASLDADDRWAPDKLAVQFAVLAGQPDVGMVCGPTTYVYSSGRPDEIKPVTANAPCRFGRAAFSRALLRGTVDPPPPSNVVYRTAVLRAVGGVPAGDNLYEDQRTFFAVNLCSAVFVTDVVLSSYAVRADSLYGSLAHDAPTKWVQRQRFERWALTWGARRSPRGALLAAETVARRAAARGRSVLAGARGA